MRFLPLLVAVALPVRALAQTGGAAALYASGDGALADGHNEDALHDCEAAVALLTDAPKEQLGRAEFCVARAAAALERYATAVESASSAFRHLEESGATARRYRADKEAASRMVSELTPRISHLVVEIAPAEAREGASITVNGKTVPPALVGAPIPVDAGPYTVAATSDGFARREVEGSLGIAAREEVRVALTAIVRPPPPEPPRPLKFLLGGSLLGGAAVWNKAEIVVGAALVAGFDFIDGAFLGLGLSGAAEPENPGDTHLLIGGLNLSARLVPGLWVGGSVGYGYGYWQDLYDRTARQHRADDRVQVTGEIEGIAATIEVAYELRRIEAGVFTIGTVSSIIIGDFVGGFVPLSVGFRTW